jgi:hypothetical protein|tara:strand:- start:403 stop:870 length:468 start_codon:yes stop_codon:yes gene_type:complete
MADLEFNITLDNVKTEMSEVWRMANKGLVGGPVLLTLGREKKTRAQEKCYHAQINDFVPTEVNGNKYDAKCWKALLVAEFAKQCMDNGEPLTKGSRHILSLCQQYMVCIRPETKEFNVKEASNFIEFLNATASEYGVVFSDKALNAYDQYRESNG